MAKRDKPPNLAARVPEELKLRLKLASALSGESMESIIIQAVEKELAANGFGPGLVAEGTDKPAHPLIVSSRPETVVEHVKENGKASRKTK